MKLHIHKDQLNFIQMLKVIIYIYSLIKNIYMIYFITLMKTMLVLGIMLASYRYFPALKILLILVAYFIPTNNLSNLNNWKKLSQLLLQFWSMRKKIYSFSLWICFIPLGFPSTWENKNFTEFSDWEKAFPGGARDHEKDTKDS